MQPNSEQQKLFKNGSRTYFNSSHFFPKEIKQNITILYAFVRKADNFVDQTPQDKEGFYDFKRKYQQALTGGKTDDQVINSFVQLKNLAGFDDQWVAAFLDSMQADLTKNKYDDISQTLKYIYGSAEVIGLFVAKILGLAEKSYQGARMLGRSMQYINFIRDLDEDLTLGRRYLPLNNSKLDGISRETAVNDQEQFTAFIEDHLQLYQEWQQEAEEYFQFIPYRYLIPIKTASDMYNWTARQIAKNPLIVFKKKVKPSLPRIILQGFWNFFYCLKY
jgi:phytoene synthase